jgi:hypothetical protein
MENSIKIYFMDVDCWNKEWVELAEDISEYETSLNFLPDYQRVIIVYSLGGKARAGRKADNLTVMSRLFRKCESLNFTQPLHDLLQG